MQIDAEWPAQTVSLADDGFGPTVADLVAPYWERPAGPTWWCHVAAGHTSVQAWLNNAKWLHPAKPGLMILLQTQITNLKKNIFSFSPSEDNRAKNS